MSKAKSKARYKGELLVKESRKTTKVHGTKVSVVSYPDPHYVSNPSYIIMEHKLNDLNKIDCDVSNSGTPNRMNPVSVSELETSALNASAVELYNYLFITLCLCR